MQGPSSIVGVETSGNIGQTQRNFWSGSTLLLLRRAIVTATLASTSQLGPPRKRQSRFNPVGISQSTATQWH